MSETQFQLPKGATAYIAPAHLGGRLPEKHFRLPAVTEITSLSRSTIYRLMDEGRFPRPVKLTGKSVAWPESRIAEWLRTRPEAA